ncbi:hypothetical protein [Pseudomonas savastanoi]|uniref:hypothetical protein n=1 Tax=Pseudomonas savastanoi TaxID=29438 RepID=UPI000F3EBF35|nr:hypothetical protein [Pseudomonas savastanoi]RML92463.1 hypothetical protein ALQ87_02050 [Pseudomonas savastanoi pv. glycinea]
MASASLIVAIGSLSLTWHLWRKTNLPILTAWIASVAGGDDGIALNIVVENSGNRPAKDIRLVAKKQHVLAALGHPPDGAIPRDAVLCFFSNKQISVLANGKRVTNAFGYLGSRSGTWKAGAVIPLIIYYQGLEGQSHSAKLNLILNDDNGFAQSSWNTSNSA